MPSIIIDPENDIKLETKTITLREVYAALEKNGFEHLRETWFGENVYIEDKFQPKAGCILAQTAFNLGVAANNGLITNFLYNAGYGDVADRTSYDDYNSLESQLNRFDLEDEAPDSPWLRGPAGDRMGEGIGQVIIAWNDLRAVNENGTRKYESKMIDGEEIQVPVYVLETYKDVAKMAYEVLEPFFDETIEVAIASRETGIPLAISG